MGKRKADCTPEEWARVLEQGRELRRAKQAAVPEYARQRQKAWRDANRERVNEAAKRRRLANIDTHKEKAREQYRKHRAKRLAESSARSREKWSGFSRALFEATLTVQGHKCAVCGAPLGEGATSHADHCHDTKTPRGVLCLHCNTAEGRIRRAGLTPLEFALRLQAYLDTPPAEVAAEALSLAG